jgi:hypothetical protein
MARMDFVASGSHLGGSIACTGSSMTRKPNGHTQLRARPGIVSRSAVSVRPCDDGGRIATRPQAAWVSADQLMVVTRLRSTRTSSV